MLGWQKKLSLVSIFLLFLLTLLGVLFNFPTLRFAVIAMERQGINDWIQLGIILTINSLIAFGTIWVWLKRKWRFSTLFHFLLILYISVNEIGIFNYNYHFLKCEEVMFGGVDCLPSRDAIILPAILFGVILATWLVSKLVGVWRHFVFVAIVILLIATPLITINKTIGCQTGDDCAAGKYCIYRGDYKKLEKKTREVKISYRSPNTDKENSATINLIEPARIKGYCQQNYHSDSWKECGYELWGVREVKDYLVGHPADTEQSRLEIAAAQTAIDEALKGLPRNDNQPLQFTHPKSTLYGLQYGCLIP
ncbi:MAG: hypothetical protein Q7S23_05975 [bacterium]|nr:hypothetical protein [bacterium]